VEVTSPSCAVGTVGRSLGTPGGQAGERGGGRAEAEGQEHASSIGPPYCRRVLCDAEVPGVWQGLGLPGLLDVHVHFLPERVFAKVWAYFDRAGPLLGRPWPVHYRTDDDARLATLAALGVRHFPSLVYAHKADMAPWLNEWSAAFADAHPQVWRTATLHPEPGVTSYVRAGLDAGVVLWKAHAQVGDYDVRDPLLDEAWGLIADAGTPVIAHVGSGPAPGRWTGPGPVADLLARHPRLPLVVAHLGMPDGAAFADLALAYEHVRLDTTMACTDFWGAPPPSPSYAARLRDLGLAGKVLWGSDFPNIPYPYAHGLEALLRLDLGDAWLREVLWGAAARLLPT